ncbi:MAG: hypothetical protein NTY53_24035 [Kiritimatiellaeota bacterium]|nr:hypothetical protein [Kiritimatiellota bacterium]
MKHYKILGLLLAPLLAYAADTTGADTDARLRVALQLAREKNEGALVERVNTAQRAMRTQPDEEKLRALEREVGIDPGGWSMHGLKIFRPTPDFLAQRDTFNRALAEAMTKDAVAVRKVCDAMGKALGDQAGLPDARREGEHAEPKPISQADAVQLFLAALESEKKGLREISAGKTIGNNMLRFYADIIQGCCEARPAVQKFRPERVAELDKLVAGACGILLRLQQPDGLFPFPDLRGKNIRFGEMIARQIDGHPEAVKDGWLVMVDPDGGTQFDTGVCGVALLTAGTTYQRLEWAQAGRRAADWALAQRCVPNFNYNSFSVGLLAHAFRVTGDTRYLAGALHKAEIGVLPGQAQNGRWLDPHNARTVYHLIILRSLNDLAAASPSGNASVNQAASKAVSALIDEFEKAGVTTVALRELQRHAALNPKPDARLKAMLELNRAVIQQKCQRGDRYKLAVAVIELAALTSQ